MKTFIFTLILFVFLAWLRYKLTKTSQFSDSLRKEFWDKESQANSTRNKDFSEINFINIPIYKLSPISLNKQEAKYYYNIINDLSKEKIARLSDYSNTELKFKYGAGNYRKLSKFDSNYILLITTFQKLANILFVDELYSEAQIVLEVAIKYCSSDICHSFVLLAEIYIILDKKDLITELISFANQSNYRNKDSIIECLNNVCTHPSKDKSHI
ncbi:MAG TPA: hypothetical protein GXZ90_07285 [Clostridiales bacterium]|nr:hypothetical protein [Clostridiales bacterium]